MGVLFPVYTGTDCRTHIFNSRELVTLAHLPALLSTGVAGLRIEARTRDAAYVSRVTRAYRKGVDAVLTGAALDFTRLEEELTGRGSFTRGHYFRPADLNKGP
jgi:putative protease